MFTHKIIFTDEQLQDIYKMHQNGYFNREIAEKYKVSNSTIARVIQNSNFTSRHPRLTNERKQMAIKLYQQYGNCMDVAKKLHMCSKTVHDILIENNVRMNDVSEIHRSLQYNECYFDIIDTPEKAYFLGLLYADGTVGSKTNNVAISLQERDVYILDCLVRELGYDGSLKEINYSQKNPRHQNQKSLSIANKHLHDALIKVGVVPKKSLILQFPNKTQVPPEYYSQFLRGYMDGDGHIAKNEHKCNFVSSRMFCEKAKEIIECTLGIHCFMLCSRSNSETFTLCVSGKKQVKKFLDWIYKDAKYCIPRKYDVYQTQYCVN